MKSKKVPSKKKPTEKAFMYDGKKIEFEKFIPHKKSCRKINLRTSDGFSEGIWAYFNKADLKKYDEDISEGIAVVILGNDSLAGIPWGAYVPVEFHGSDRPICYLAKLSGDIVQYKGKVKP